MKIKINLKMAQKLNKFEETRLLSSRALEISKGANPKIDLKKEKIDAKLNQDYIKIAQKELEKGVIELEIKKNN